MDTITEREDARRAFTRACLVGGSIGALIFLWMLTRGSFDLFEWQRVGDFYDAQAHSLLNGHLTINPKILGIESFTVNGNPQMYQGPVPALMRMPILLVAGHSLDGRLTQPSMLVAFVVALVFACRLHWKMRKLLRGDAPVTRAEAILVGVFTFVLAGGSILLYEASRAWVYHEAGLWGAAFALIAIDQLMRYRERPTLAPLFLAALAAACSVLTRASVGIGPIAGLGLVGGAVLARDLAAWWNVRRADRGHETPRFQISRLVTWAAPERPTDQPARRLDSFLPAAAAVLPLALYAIVNYAKFRTLFSVPVRTQAFSLVDPGRQVFLDANNGTWFGLQFAPTTVLQYLRPDALHFTSLFPFVDFPKFPGRIVGDVIFDLYDRSSSLPSSLPFFFVLSIVGLVALFRPARWRDEKLHVARVGVVTGIACGLLIIPFGYIANRYFVDILPFFAIAGAAGFQVVVARLARTKSEASERTKWRALVALIAVLAVFTTWVNFALAINYQRLWSYNLDASVLSGYIGFRRDVNNAFGGDRITIERTDGALPDGVGRPFALVVAGDCDGLYVSDAMLTNIIKRTPWNAVERNERAGHFVFEATFPKRPVGTRVPIFTNGPRDDPNILFAEYRPDDSILFEYRTDRRGESRRYVPFPIEFGREYRIDLSADWRIDLMTVKVDDVAMLDTFYRFKGHDFRFGRGDGVDGVEARFPGRLERKPPTTPLCHALVEDARRG